MNLGYTFAGFNDSFLEGAPAQGMAWAIADHPKYCPWGNGKPVNGANDTYKSYETNPDAAQKVKSAIRTLRILGEGLNLNGKIGVYGFSRGSDAGSMAIGDRIVPEFENAGFNIGTPDSVQAAALGPGVFDFTQIYNTTGDGDNNLETRCPWGWGALKDNYELWNSMGSSYLAQSSKTAPVLFFYNTNDSHYYADQITKFKARLDSINVPTSSLIDYGTGHAVPQTSTSLNKLYAFFSEYLTPQSPIRVKEDSADICMVTVDTETGKNMLVWEPKSGYHIKEYRIYRESKVVNVYNQIGTVLFNEVSKFIDPTVLPELEQSKYKLSVVDSFNIESELGKYHKPIFLQYISTGASVELEWDAYEVEYGSININNYVIFRGSDSTRLQIIDTVLASSRTYTDHDTLALKSLMFYRVAGVKNETCAKAGINSNESGRAVFCLSNLANNNLFALNTTEAVKTFSRSLFLSPNPVREELNLSFNIANPVELHIGIYDITGFLLYKTEKKYNYTGQQNETIRLDEHSFPKGIYYVSVGCQEWQVTKKFIKE